MLSLARIEHAERRIAERQSAVKRKLSQYRGDPDGYAREVLGVTLTPAQSECLRAAERPPYRVIVPAANIVGKTLMSAVWLSYLYDTRDPAFIIVVAPRRNTIRDTSWRELRKLRTKAGLGGFTGPRSLEMRSSDSHICMGDTASNIHAMKGKHEDAVFVLIEEAGGVDKEVWAAVETMLNGIEYGMLAVLNPMETACQAYREERSGHYFVKRLSALDHPNIALELAGMPPLIPSAVRLEWVRMMVNKHCDRIDGTDAKGNDFEFPPGSGEWWHPNMEVEVAVLGLWPSEGSDSIWTQILFDRCVANRKEIVPDWRTTIGVDAARFGDDMTAIVVRRGLCVVHCEQHNGWDGTRLAGRLKELCETFRGPQRAEEVRVYIDDTGAWGSSAMDQADGFTFIGINASTTAQDEAHYYRMRTELWFQSAEIAREGLADLSRLSKDDRDALAVQLIAQKYKYRPNTGQKWCVEKDVIKKELGHSPDLADAYNLCFCTKEPGGHDSIGGSLA